MIVVCRLGGGFGSGDVGPSAADELEEGVERIGVAGLVPALAAGGAEDLVDDRIESGVE
jgi:hypothetical protein